ncbi:HNH endonuclease [Selenomonas sp. AE3005]|uniref:HNH endonuclease n=1 Tax=Selenomonas sp. AE3005 TaxID=1485543 RepID=UPI00068F48BE|nr:HNH endonuclease [Selenomonas sp. AE3005]
MIEFDITGGSVMIDDEFDWLMDFSWHINKQGYAVHFVNKKDADFWGLPARKAVYMHRVVAALTEGDSEVVDHINHIKTDNRRDNLRICSQAENLRNQESRRRFKGVFYLKNRKKCWQSAIVVDGKKQFLGNFYSQEEAAKAYNEAAIEYFGEFACLNEVA